jgi:hypothetical protein
MHAPVYRRFQMNRSVGLVLALGLLASIALAAATFDWPNDDPALLPGADARVSLLAKEQRYFDATIARHAAMEEAAGAQYVPYVQAAYYDPQAGQIDVTQYQADQNAAAGMMTRDELDQLYGGH